MNINKNKNQMGNTTKEKVSTIKDKMTDSSKEQK